jgi:Spy/CpxP family protein refolding chaperone
MKTLCTVVTLIVGLSVCPKLVAADDPPGERGERARERMAETMADLNLTDEQETKIADVRKENRPKIQEAAKELAALVKDEVEKVREVLTAEQKEKLRAFKEERKERRIEGLAARICHLRDLDVTDAEIAQIEEIREGVRPKVESLMKDLSRVLTDEQREAREKALKAGESRREVRESLNLSGEQREKVESIGKELVGVVRDELEKMRSVLSSEQQEQLATGKEERKDRVRDRLACAIVNFNDLGLTDEQKTKIGAIRQEFRPKVQEAGNKLRAAIREEVSQVLSVIRS